MKTNKKYYILYKAIKDEQGEIIDAENINDFLTYEDIKNYLQCSYRDIKNIINQNINNLKSIKTLKNKYFIIKE